MTRWMKVPALAGLALGLFVVTASDELAAASKAEEVKKYAQELRTAKDAKVKITALGEIGKAGLIDKALVADSIKDIVAALKDGDAGVRAAAAHAYGQVARATEDKKAVVTTLVKMMKEDGDENVKYGAIQGLASMRDGAKDAVGELKKLHDEEVDKARKEAEAKKAKVNNPQTKLSRATQDAMRAINDRN